MTIHQGEILRAWMKASPKKMQEYADILDMTPQGLNHHLRMEVLTDDFIRLVKEKLKIGFQGDKIFAIYPTNVGEVMIINDGDRLKMKVPLVPQYAYAGYLTGYGDMEFIERLPIREWTVEKEHKGRYISFEVRGDSMNDGSIESYIEGDEVLGREVPIHHWQNKLHFKEWDFIVVHKVDGIVLKRITEHNIKEQTITLHSLNSNFPDQVVSLNDVAQLFNVVKLSRNK
jgi:SOS-response transcriptional repressor LexA